MYIHIYMHININAYLLIYSRRYEHLNDEVQAVLVYFKVESGSILPYEIQVCVCVYVYVLYVYKYNYMYTYIERSMP
jgi:hypothetical protein